jgi:CDP-glycerol glycerophosphotransferase
VFWLFPVKKNRIFFISYEGKQYSCNPKYIFEYLYKRYEDKYDYVWCIDESSIFPKNYQNTKLVKKRSLLYTFYVVTSKIYISNVGISIYIPRRKGQIIINTWHGGGAYKRVALDSNEKLYIQYQKFILKIASNETTYFLSSCERFSDVMSVSFCTDKNKFLPTGMPRNDMLFASQISLDKKIKKQFNINEEYGVVLYAPTYRGSGKEKINIQDIDIVMTTNMLENHFKRKFIFLYRIHRYSIHTLDLKEGIDVNSYPDMQELLCMADILITDYSSSMWDFSLTYKPCFIYAPDLDNYKSERDFYTPIEDWPFPVAQSNEELEQNILMFDNDEYIKNIKKHHTELKSFENGSARESICDLIVSKTVAPV